MKFNWESAYDLGLEFINDQHKQFFAIANEAAALAEDATATDEALLAVASKLGDYTLYHLSTEEEYFHKFGYEGAHLHTEVHNAFRSQVQKFIDSIRMEGSDKHAIANQMALFCGNWLGSHILVMDKMYASFFKEHGMV